MADDHYGNGSSRRAFSKAGTNEQRANAAPLILRPHRHRAKADDQASSPRSVERNWREQDMPDDLLSVRGDERNADLPRRAHGIDDARLVELTEGQIVDESDCRLVTRALVANIHQS